MELHLNIPSPFYHEFEQYQKLLEFLREQDIELNISRKSEGYAISKCILDSGTVVERHAIYPNTPNAAIGQIKADIMAITMCLREFGYKVTFEDFEKEQPEKITKSKLNSCHTIKEVVNLLESVNHPDLKKVKGFIEEKRVSGGRPSRKQIIDLIYTEKDEIRKPQRSGVKWAEVKALWRDKFSSSKYAKMYKSLDEFCTFAPDSECLT